MKSFETKSEATEYMNNNFADYALTGLAVVLKAGPMIAKHLGCKVGYYVNIDQVA